MASMSIGGRSAVGAVTDRHGSVHAAALLAGRTASGGQYAVRASLREFFRGLAFFPSAEPVGMS